MIRLLSDGRFHSGEELAARLGVSRSAIWKLLQRLRGMGVEVDAVRGRGYRLPRPPELLQASRLAAAVGPEMDVHLLDQVDSTSDELRRRLRSRVVRPVGCVAEYQSAGRGRRGRKWCSPYAANLYFSMALPVGGGMQVLAGLSLAVGAAVAEALSDLGLQGVALKWPNDLQVAGRKLGGILLEVSGESQGPCQVICGVGLNLGMAERNGELIDQPWTDLRREMGAACPGRNEVAVKVLQAVWACLRDYAQMGFASWHRRVCERNALLGRNVQVSLEQQLIEGIALEIDAMGCLVVETPQGARSLSSGEVTVRLSR